MRFSGSVESAEQRCNKKQKIADIAEFRKRVTEGSESENEAEDVDKSITKTCKKTQKLLNEKINCVYFSVSCLRSWPALLG